MTVMTDRWGERGPGFDRKAAETVFKALMALDDDSALVLGRVLVADAMRYEQVTHRDQIAAAEQARVAKRAEALGTRLAAEALAKTRTGQDPSAEVAGLVALAKAYNPNETRDWHGRWTDAHAHIGYDGGKPLEHTVAVRSGIEAHAHLHRADAARFQQAYQQIGDLIAPYKGLGDRAILHVTVADKQGKQHTEVLDMPGRGQKLKLADRVPKGSHVTSAHVTVTPGLDVSGAALDAGSLLHPRVGAVAAQTVERGAGNTERLQRYHEEANAKPEEGDEFVHRGFFRRLAAGSKLLEDSLGDAAPRKLKYALQVGGYLGEYGPQAQKVIGPSADRAAYRYRGTERAVDPRLGNALESVRVNPNLSGPGKREYLLHGREGRTPAEWTPSEALLYFRRLLPAESRNRLQLASGHVPPSQGVILDDKGRAVHEAVGYGEDWYLPFNLRHLGALKGGEYIRTRSYGGPTTEDLYTGLMTGARGFTVVSHNGVYTVDLDDNLRGGRRFSDKAARMTARYGQLLDAVKSRQVTATPLPPAKLKELRTKAAGYADPDEDREAYTKELARLEARERGNPQFSPQQRGEAAVAWLDAQAARRRTADGQVASAGDLVNDLVNTEARRAHAAHVAGAKQMGVAPMRDEAAYRKEVAAALHSGDPYQAVANVAHAMGKDKEFTAAMERAQDEYARSLAPMALNGKGYYEALKALQEQFPYYIARVEFHPWTDQLISEHEQGMDTGYVKPRHNRPERALAGYYDTTITGHGKATADSIRYQNFPVRQGKVNYLDRKGEKAETKTEDRAKGAVDERTAAELRAGADKKLLAELLDQTHFAGPGAVTLTDGKRVDVSAGDDLRQVFGQSTVANSALKELYTTPRHELEARADDPAQQAALHSLLERALNEATENKTRPLVKVGTDTAEHFRRGGRIEQAKAVPAVVAEKLREWNKDHEFTGRGYDDSKNPTADEVQAAYAGDGRLEDLVQRKELPAKLDDAGFTDSLTKLKADIEADHDKALQHAQRGNVAERDRLDRRANRRADALLRAAQLHRNYGKAVQRDREAQVIRPEPLGDQEANVRNELKFQFQLPPKSPDQSASDYADMVDEMAQRAMERERNEGHHSPPIINA